MSRVYLSFIKFLGVNNQTLKTVGESQCLMIFSALLQCTNRTLKNDVTGMSSNTLEPNPSFSLENQGQKHEANPIVSIVMVSKRALLCGTQTRCLLWPGDQIDFINHKY